MSHERVSRWRVGAVAASALVSLGLLYASPLLLTATVIPLGYVLYGALSSVPADAAVRIERSVSDGAPPPGDRVTVRLTVENVSEATLPDLRVVDGVPDDLAVVEGSPRACLALRPGESATVTYDVAARRGDFAFVDPIVRLRPFSAARVVTETVPATGDRELSSLDPVSAAPVESTTLSRTGTRPTDGGGEGLEFHSTREYRAGDSISRIHWRRFAKAGELTTVSYREERALRVVVAVDARAVGRVRPRAGTPTAAALSGYAAERFYETLVAAGVTTGAAAFGLDEADVSVPTGAGPVPWVAGDRENATALARTLFDAVGRVADRPVDEPTGDSAGASAGAEPGSDGSVSAEGAAGDGTGGEDPDGEDATASRRADASEATAPDGGVDDVRYLLSQFPPTAHVVFASPLLDDRAVEFVRRVRRQEYPVTVFSPAATGSGGETDAGARGGTLGQTVAARERDVRLAEASATGATVVDWDRSESIEVALAESLAALSGGGRD